jgi:hypothetical protein
MLIVSDRLASQTLFGHWMLPFERTLGIRQIHRRFEENSNIRKQKNEWGFGLDFSG